MSTLAVLSLIFTVFNSPVICSPVLVLNNESIKFFKKYSCEYPYMELI